MQEITDNIYVLVSFSMIGTFLLVVSFILFYVRNQNKQLKQKSQANIDALNYQKTLLNAVIQSQENERKRIGQDLHDEVGGALSNLRILINRFGNGVDEKSVQTPVELYKELIDKIIQNVRDISHSLSPPGLALFGFSEALEEIKDVVCKGDESLISITNHAETATNALPYDVALALVRILQELVTNTLKHSGAKRIGISFFMKNNLLAIHYTDDGKGYDMTDKNNRRGMGMQNIESRLHMIGASHYIKTNINEGFGMFIYLDPDRGSIF